MKTLRDRMIGYEQCYSYLIPSRTYTIVRCDGRGFSKFTKNMNKPFDDDFSESMNYAAIEMCKKFNPDFAYTQSDEITLVFSDFGENQEAMFKGKVQKICSLTASRATASFNKKMLMLDMEKSEDVGDINNIIDGSAIYDVEFDSRVYIIPDIKEVANCIVWRQQDAGRNSISMAAGALYSHKQLHKKSSQEKLDMMFDKGVHWSDYPIKYKRGVIIKKEEFEVASSDSESGVTIRKRWVVDEETPIFTQNWEYLYDLIPKNTI